FRTHLPGHPGSSERRRRRRARHAIHHERCVTTSAETLRCARHPNVETVLRCGRCETPICPRCLIPTPVGARCPTCAQVKRFALLLKPAELARAIGFGVLVGAIGTVIATFIGGFLPLLAWMVVGFVVG